MLDGRTHDLEERRRPDPKQQHRDREDPHQHGGRPGSAGRTAAARSASPLRVLPRSRVGRRAFLTSAVDGVSAAYDPDAVRSLAGKSATALTMLSPSGYVLVEGRRYEAFCQSGQAPVGSDLEVVGADNFRLIVSHTPSL